MKTTTERPRRATYRTPSRIDINTGHRTFDGLADCITTGNVVSNVQRSSYIREATRTECNGHDFPPGHLQKFDLDGFKHLHGFAQIRRHVAALTAKSGGILYAFRNGRTVHGYILTTREHGHLHTYHTGPTYKSRRVLETVRPYVCNP